MTGGRQTLFIKGVPPLVGRRQKARQRLATHDPGGEAKVTGAEGDGKRMGRFRHRRDGRVTPPLLKQLAAKALLLLF